MSLDIDLDQVAAEIPAEQIVELFQLGFNHGVTGNFAGSRYLPAAQVPGRVLQIGRPVTIGERKREAADDRRQPVHKRIAPQQLDQFGVRLERISPAVSGEPARDLHGIEADIGADIDEHGVGRDKAQQNREVFFLVAAAVDQIDRASEIVAIDEHRRLIEQIGQRNAVADVAAEPVADKVEIAPHPFEHSLDAVEPAAQRREPRRLLAGVLRRHRNGSHPSVRAPLTPRLEKSHRRRPSRPRVRAGEFSGFDQSSPNPATSGGATARPRRLTAPAPRSARPGYRAAASPAATPPHEPRPDARRRRIADWRRAARSAARSLRRW